MPDLLDTPPATVRAGEVTLQTLLDLFGPIPARRIVADPRPGTATEDDLIRLHDREDRGCELIDGTLVEKDVSGIASLIAIRIAKLLANFVDDRRLGFVLGEQAMLRLVVGRVRMPDVSFVDRGQVPGGEFPDEPIVDLFPTLAVEVISPGNTRREMDGKLADYFASGSRLVWYVFPNRREVEVYTGRDDRRTLTVADMLDGGDVLAGLAIPVADVFAVAKLPTAEPTP